MATEPQSSDHSQSGLNAEARAAHSLTYWQLVRRRFARNTYAMSELAGCILIILTAVFAGFLAPYAPQTTDQSLLSTPRSGSRYLTPKVAFRGRSSTGFPRK